MTNQSPTEFNVAQAAEGLVTDAAKVVIDAFTKGPTSPQTIADATVLVVDGITFTEQEANALLARAIAWEQKNQTTFIAAIERLLSKL